MCCSTQPYYKSAAHPGGRPARPVMRALGAAPHIAEQGNRKCANWAEGRSGILASSAQTRPRTAARARPRHACGLTWHRACVAGALVT